MLSASVRRASRTLLGAARWRCLSSNGEMAEAGVSEGEQAQSAAKVHSFLRVPAFSEETSKASVTSWEHAEGDFVREGEALCELETDEVMADVDMERDGYLAKILVAAGSSAVPVGHELAIVVDEEEHIAQFADWVSADGPAPVAAASETTPAAVAAEPDGATVLRLLNKLAKEEDGALADAEIAKALKKLARDNHQGLLFAYKGSMDGDEFDTEFFLENALEILEEEAES